jgi:membrane-bound lytic murein transglycosylase B
MKGSALLAGLSLATLLAPVLAAEAGAKGPAPAAAVKARAAKPATTRAAQGPSYAAREDAMKLADEIAEQQQLDAAYVRRSIASARQLPLVSKLILPAASPSAKNWQLYRSRFVEPHRIKAGVAFWTAHRALLERAQRDYGVPPEIIVGVIGVETIYGQQLGNFRVLDALATLSLDFPAEHPRFEERRSFFRAELAQFLKLKQHTGIDPGAWRGSYAGAMGLPQFMPSSWLRFAVDFDGDGKIDLFHSVADVIGSVANYFKAFDWRPGMPTHYEVTFDAATLDKDALLLPDILPTFDVAAFTARGALLDETGQAHKGRLALVELHNGSSEPQYVAGTENFYAITRYNWSSYYAMAVIELGQAVAETIRHGGPTAGATK